MQSASREKIRNLMKEAHKKYKLPPGEFKEIKFKHLLDPVPGITRAYGNNRYMVLIQDEAMTTHGPSIRAMIQRLDYTPIPNHWSEIQKIKNEIFGKEVMAIEYYPKESKLIDDYNLYWISIYPDGVIPEL